MSDRIRRPDLEIVAVSYPDYLADKVMPMLAKRQVSGVQYYEPYSADFEAQYNRTANASSIAAITGNIYASAYTSYTCLEDYARVIANYTEIRQAGNDLQGLQESMARRAKRAYYNKLESLVAAAVLTPADSATNISAAPLAGIESAVQAQRDKGLGRVAVVLSNHNFVELKKNAEIKARMTNSGVITAGLEPRFITATQLAAIFGADEVLVGKDDIWYTGQVSGGLADNLAVVCLPDRAMEPVDEPQFGRILYYEFDSMDGHFVIESFHDDVADTEVVDAKGLYAVKTFNAGLASVLTLAVSSSASSESSL